MITVKFIYAELLGVMQWPSGTVASEFRNVEIARPDVYADYYGALPLVATARPPEQWIITRLAFRGRFSAAEMAGLEYAAADNPAALIGARVQAAGLRAKLADIAAATYVDLKRADTRAGVQALEAASLIGIGRAAIILDTPPTQAELYLR